MKETSYSILAGILLVVATLLMVVLRAQFVDFSAPIFRGLISILISVGLILIALGCKQIFRPQQKYRVFDDPAPETVSTAYISLKWKCIKVNKLFCQLLGYDARELAQMDFQRLIHPVDFKNDFPSIRKMLDGQQYVHQSQQRFLDKNGDLVLLSVTMSVTRDKEEKPLYFICQFQKSHSLESADYAKVYSTTA